MGKNKNILHRERDPPRGTLVTALIFFPHHFTSKKWSRTESRPPSKNLKDLLLLYYIDIKRQYHTMSYNLKPDNDNICQCGCIINKYYMSIYFKAAKYQSSVQGRDHIQVVNQYRYKPR